MKKIKKEYRLISVRMDKAEYMRFEKMKKDITAATNLPISIHWLLNQALVHGGKHLNSTYL